jgi:hypothetical protein
VVVARRRLDAEAPVVLAGGIVIALADVMLGFWPWWLPLVAAFAGVAMFSKGVVRFLKA